MRFGISALPKRSPTCSKSFLDSSPLLEKFSNIDNRSSLVGISVHSSAHSPSGPNASTNVFPSHSLRCISNVLYSIDNLDLSIYNNCYLTENSSKAWRSLTTLDHFYC